MKRLEVYKCKDCGNMTKLKTVQCIDCGEFNSFEIICKTSCCNVIVHEKEMWCPQCGDELE